MAHERTSQSAEGRPRFTMGGATFELLAGPESHPDGSALVLMTMPPEQGRFLAPDHHHPTREGVEVVSGQASVTHGYGEKRVAAGEKWSGLVREGARLEQAGGLPGDFMKRWSDDIGVEFAHPGHG